VRDAQPKLKAQAVECLGISPDDSTEQKRFDEKLGLGYPLLSDLEHHIASAYGVWGEKQIFGKKSQGIIRSAFLIDEQGRVAQSWYKISPEKTIPELMKVL
jgi:thioredoxin-dependent peroxiredoxin